MGCNFDRMVTVKVNLIKEKLPLKLFVAFRMIEKRENRKTPSPSSLLSVPAFLD